MQGLRKHSQCMCGVNVYWQIVKDGMRLRKTENSEKPRQFSKAEESGFGTLEHMPRFVSHRRHLPVPLLGFCSPAPHGRTWQ